MINQLSQELKDAMKSHDSERVSVLRMLISELKNKNIELTANGAELTKEEALKVLTKEAKKRKDSIEAFVSGGRDDLVASEQAELKIIEEYLPKQMEEDEISKIIDEVIASVGTDSGFGMIMGQVMAKVGTLADGTVVKNILNQKLGN